MHLVSRPGLWLPVPVGFRSLTAARGLVGSLRQRRVLVGRCKLRAARIAFRFARRTEGPELACNLAIHSNGTSAAGLRDGAHRSRTPGAMVLATPRRCGVPRGQTPGTRLDRERAAYERTRTLAKRRRTAS